ncbi:hypothetical protein QFC22_001617 [Naganishia vaughanmartiniae]|uniref:Uncharacterized protein n=1 Tax=Naganishia vaughanmartiniae TaxID=1424756 RepID=A0ACC2XH99_9TREE|nr:hypothetical protein QFC22_001617 [Naganishia vaughanmartiniae]
MIVLVTYAFNSLTTKEDLADIDAFFKDKKTEKYKLALAQTKDTIQASIGWLERDREDVETVSRHFRMGLLKALY